MKKVNKIGFFEKQVTKRQLAPFPFECLGLGLGYPGYKAVNKPKELAITLFVLKHVFCFREWLL